MFVSIRLREELTAYAAQARCVDRSYPFFASQKSIRSGFNANSLAQTFALLYEGAGLEGASSHSGRRTAITKWARQISTVGGSLRDVQLLAGHSALGTTQRYIEGSDEAKRRVVELD